MNYNQCTECGKAVNHGEFVKRDGKVYHVMLRNRGIIQPTDLAFACDDCFFKHREEQERGK